MAGSSNAACLLSLLPMIVNISPKLEPLLAFLYPTHSILKEGDMYSGKFIIHKDVKSPSEQDRLNAYYPDGIFISSRLFDEFLTPERLRELCIEFAKSHLGNRKTKLEVSSESTPDDYINFMYGLFTEEEEESILSLFDLAGSSAFTSEFIKLSATIPIPKLQSAMNTFVTKVLSAKEGSPVFYLRKASVLSKKIRANMMKAMDEYIDRCPDDTGLSLCKFYSDLFV